MIIKHAFITKFRALQNVEFDLGKKITAIVGQNGTMKTTVLGILSQTFTISKEHKMHGEQTIDGYNFHSQFGEKFKMSEKDIPGEHLWKLDLYPQIYKKDCFEAESIERDKNTKIPRFWSTEGKKKGVGYPQIPAYYISLKRVTPIGEEKKFTYITELTEEEKRFLTSEYKEIFSVIDSEEINVDSISSSNKHTASIHNNNHDALAISAGQDNLGKLLIAVLSFKRLMEKYKDDYKGGLLLIDEIESTFHASAQSKLIKRMYKYAKDYKIQFVYTTHSPAVIKSTFFDKYNKKDAQLLYLKKVGDKVIGFNNPEIENVIAELSGEVLQEKTKKIKRFEVFSEDNVARQFLNNLLVGYKKYIRFNTCSIGAEEYIELLRVGLESVKKAVVILDGDKKTKAVYNKLEKNLINNVMFLPSEDCPEKMFYLFLNELSPDDPFWNNEPGKYDKIKCFKDYLSLPEKKAETKTYKDWFKANEPYWERGNKKLYNYWKIKKIDEYNSFVEEFIGTYNRVTLIYGGEQIE